MRELTRSSSLGLPLCKGEGEGEYSTDNIVKKSVSLTQQK